MVAQACLSRYGLAGPALGIGQHSRLRCKGNTILKDPILNAMPRKAAAAEAEAVHAEGTSCQLKAVQQLNSNQQQHDFGTATFDSTQASAGSNNEQQICLNQLQNQST